MLFGIELAKFFPTFAKNSLNALAMVCWSVISTSFLIIFVQF